MAGAAQERPSSWLLLESQEVEALFEVPVAPLAEWLDATYRVTSAEAEMDGLDWENFLVELLDGPGHRPNDRHRTDVRMTCFSFRHLSEW